MSRNYKCPVCGAPIEGDKCEYCGCVIYDFANISTETPGYISMRTKIDGKEFILRFKAIAIDPTIDITYDDYAAIGRNGSVITTHASKIGTLSVDFKIIEDDGNLFTIIDADRPYRESWRDDL